MKRTFVWRGTLPLWLLLLAGLPLVALFFLSIVAAGVLVIGGAVVASLLLPLLGGRRRPSSGDGTIELAPSQFRRLPESRQRP
ncbi:MAG: hypothetical protein U0802_16165 [Candidatus Binatia bacterium]